MSTPRSTMMRMSDGVHLLVRQYGVVEATKPIILATHGLQSHGGWYDWSCRYFQSAGYPVWFVDRRGSGGSEGPRGHARDERRLLADLLQLRHAARCESVAPPVLMGVCWAAKLLAASATTSPNGLSAVVLAYPAFATRFDASLRQRALLRLSAWLGIDRRPVASPLRPEHFTDSIAAREMIAADPLSTRTLSAAMARVDRSLTKQVERYLAGVSSPLLVLLSGRDRISRVDRVAEMMRRTQPEATVKRFDRSAHVMEFEPDREAIFAEIARWLDRRVGARA